MKDRLNAITRRIIGAAIDVHRELGPGMLESAYESCLASLLHQCGMKVERQKRLPAVFQGQLVDCAYKIDLLVEGEVIVEVKSVEGFAPVHSAKLRSYLRCSERKVGLIINFNVKWLTRDGMKRIVNGFPD